MNSSFPFFLLVLLYILSLQSPLCLNESFAADAQTDQITKDTNTVNDSDNVKLMINQAVQDKTGVNLLWINIVISVVGLIAVLAAFLTVILGLKLQQINTAKKEIMVALAEFDKVSKINKLESEIRVFGSRSLWDGLAIRAEKLKEIAPDHYGGYFVYGIYLGMQKHEHKEAIENLLVADKLINGDNAQIKYNLSCFNSCLEKKNEAISYMKQCLILDKQYCLDRLNTNDPDLDNIRNTDEFKEILKLMGLMP